MRRVALAVLAIVTIAVLGCQQEKPPEKPKMTIPKGQVLVKEDALAVFVDQTEVQMQTAQAALKKRDAAGAARAVRLAVGFVKLEAVQAKGDFKKKLNGAAAALDKIAAALERGETVRSEEMSAAFGRAEDALGRHHHQKAKAAVKAGAAQKVRRRMAASAAAVEAAVKWTGGKPTSEDKAAVAAVKSLADKMAQGGEWTAEEANMVLSGLKGQIDKLKAVVEPAPAAAGTPSGGGN
jgi:hypothetical protein